MAYRYGVELIPYADFASRAYRARQIICGQYASWTAEMFMVHISVADFFQCSNESLPALTRDLERIAKKEHGFAPTLRHGGVNVFPSETSTIFLDFKVGTQPAIGYIETIHNDVLAIIQGTNGSVPHTKVAGEDYWPHLPLLQNARLHPTIFQEAVEFSGTVVKDLQIPDTTSAWKLWFVRYESERAGEDWCDGRWEADLRWTILDSFQL